MMKINLVTDRTNSTYCIFVDLFPICCGASFLVLITRNLFPQTEIWKMDQPNVSTLFLEMLVLILLAVLGITGPVAVKQFVWVRKELYF